MDSGETDLGRLLASMRPMLADGVYVFATVPAGRSVPPGLDPIMRFREREGETLILAQEEARTAGLAASAGFRLITLDVHSSLEAVGFLAAVTARLAAAGIGVNPVSAFYHDHLFVPAGHAVEAMSILEGLAAEHAASAVGGGDDEG